MRADKAEFNADKAAPDPLIGTMTKMIVATKSVKAGAPRPSPAPVDITGDHAVSFEPGDPPRSGSLVIYDSSRQPDPPLLADEVEVVLPTVSGTGVRRRTVSAQRVPVIEAVALLRDLDAGSPSAGSLGNGSDGGTRAHRPRASLPFGHHRGLGHLARRAVRSCRPAHPGRARPRQRSVGPRRRPSAGGATSSPPTRSTRRTRR